MNQINILSVYIYGFDLVCISRIYNVIYKMKKIKSNQIKKEENDILKPYYISFKNS